jgi:hypothetical protein
LGFFRLGALAFQLGEKVISFGPKKIYQLVEDFYATNKAV